MYTKATGMKLRKMFIFLWLVVLFAVIGAIFWYNEIQYQLPTPVPECYEPIKTGTQVKLPAELHLDKNRPTFLHFFNPDCPCSRFNIPEFKKLVLQYGQQLNFRIVVLAKKAYSEKEIRKKFAIDVPITFDKNETISTLCGVYATPQVAILDAGNRMYYRGNYNRYRYCTDERTNYANIAVEGLLKKKSWLQFNKFALISYGCSLPGCGN